MKDLKKLVAECEEDLRSLGYKPCENITWTVNTRAQKRWGRCHYRSKTACEIEISNRLLQDEVSDQAAKDTIMHELIHTIRYQDGKPASKHTGLWLRIAEDVNHRLPQYTIKRCTPSEEKGLEPVVNYIVRCEHCGTEYRRIRMCNFIEHPENYKCGVCGFKLARIK